MSISRFCMILALAAALAAPLAGAFVATPASAQPTDPRRAVQQGQALPLGRVLQQVLPNFPGQLLRADLVRDRNGALVYQLRILDDSGQVNLVTTDARSGRILGVQRGGR